MRIPDIESLMRLKSNHQSLLEEPVDAQQHSHNFRYDYIAMTVSTPSLADEIPELSGHVFRGSTSAASQIPTDQLHRDSDVLMAPLFVEKDSGSIEDHASTQNQGSNYHSQESPTKGIYELLECHDLIGMSARMNQTRCGQDTNLLKRLRLRGKGSRCIMVAAFCQAAGSSLCFRYSDNAHGSDDYVHSPNVHLKPIVSMARRASVHLGYHMCLFERSP